MATRRKKENQHVTQAEKRALQVLYDHAPLRTTEFGKRMWPDKPMGWTKESGYYGVGHSLSSGAFLGRLRKKGWIDREWAQDPSTHRFTFIGYGLTEEGRLARKWPIKNILTPRERQKLYKAMREGDHETEQAIRDKYLAQGRRLTGPIGRLRYKVAPTNPPTEPPENG
jgi:hypothetical protein